MTEVETPKQRLGRLVRDRRKARGLDQDELKPLGGPGAASMYLIEDGRAPRMQKRTKEGLERSLRWARGSIDAILRGGDAVELPDGIDLDDERVRAAQDAAIHGMADAHRYSSDAPGRVIDSVIDLLRIARKTPPGEPRTMLLLAAHTVLGYMTSDYAPAVSGGEPGPDETRQ